MRRQDALFVAMAVGTIAFAIAFVYSAFTPESIVWYYPVDHRWAFEIKPSGVAMDFYGRLLQALVAWSIAFVVALAIARKVRSAGTRAVVLVGGWALAATIFVMFFYGWTLHFRTLTPPPIPSWYQPR
jgi:hypothetical protein